MRVDIVQVVRMAIQQVQQRHVVIANVVRVRVHVINVVRRRINIVVAVRVIVREVVRHVAASIRVVIVVHSISGVAVRVAIVGIVINMHVV